MDYGEHYTQYRMIMFIALEKNNLNNYNYEIKFIKLMEITGVKIVPIYSIHVFFLFTVNIV
jgi:hypothetical protein